MTAAATQAIPVRQVLQPLLRRGRAAAEEAAVVASLPRYCQATKKEKDQTSALRWCFN